MKDLPERLGPFVVEGELGRGGMGVVYLGRDARLDRQVAIKVLPEEMCENPDRLARFEREARTLASLNHPNLAAVYGLYEHLGQQLLVMEYVPGQHLGERISAGPAMGVREALGVGAQIAAGLEAAHENGVVHRDMKPANVRVRPDGTVKVLDFGLAKPENEAPSSAGDDEETQSMAPTEAGRVLGTAGYMSPEQARGKPVDKRADIWAFGAVLYECLTGSRAFPGETAMDAIVAILEHDPAWDCLPDQTPPRVMDLLRRCMEKDVRRRLRDIGDARLELESLLSVGGTQQFVTFGARATMEGFLSEAAARAETAAGDASAGADGASGSRLSGSSGLVGTGGTRSRGLPASVTPFVGRRRELSALEDLVREARLVTLVGSGGVGKSRLAAEMARNRQAAYVGGAWLVDLASMTDASLAAAEVARAFGLGDAEGRDASQILLEHLAGREVLLVLDNTEHLLEGVRPLVEALLGGCPGLRVVLTSRGATGLLGESVYRVPAMATPAADLDDPARLVENESVALFVDRARAVRPGFGVDGQNAAAVRRICRELDGIPLAIELAAARVKLLSPDQIADRLHDRFKLLRGSKSINPRQQTLLAAIGWSYEHLEESEKALFRRLCVFRGGATLSGAESVAAAAYEEGPEIEDWEVLDLLGELVDKSLVIVDDASRAGGDTRYRILETIRQFGLEQLEASGESARARDLHLDMVAKLALRAESQLMGRDQKAWLDRLELEHDNVRAALQWVLQGEGDLEQGRRIAGSVWRFWAYRGHIVEGRTRLVELDQRGAGGQPSPAWAKLREGISWIAMMVGDLATAVMFARAGLEIARLAGEKRTTSNLLNCLGAACHGEMLSERALDYFEESLAIRKELGDQTLIAQALHNIAECRRQFGQLDEARAQYGEALKILESTGDTLLSAQAHANMGWLELQEGALDEAWRRCTRALGMVLTLSARTEIPACLEQAASIAVASGKLERAARLFAAAEAARASLASPPRPSSEAEYLPSLSKLRDEMDPARLEECWAEGSEMKLRRAANYALEGEGEPISASG